MVGFHTWLYERFVQLFKTLLTEPGVNIRERRAFEGSVEFVYMKLLFEVERVGNWGEFISAFDMSNVIGSSPAYAKEDPPQGINGIGMY